MKNWINYKALPNAKMALNLEPLSDSLQIILSKADLGLDFTKNLQIIVDYCPFLKQSLINLEDESIFLIAPDQYLEQLLLEMDQKLAQDAYFTLDDLMVYLRKKKQKFALIIALADLLSLFDLKQVTYYLSEFAAKSLDLALIHALKAFLPILDEKQSPFLHKSLKTQLDQLPIFIIAMGKAGAYELNYSSDVDIIGLYEGEGFDFTRQDRLPQNMKRVAHLVAKLMEERTKDGYVFRIDYRLRPDPNVTPPFIEVNAAEIYYESMGLNWERAAFIKARIIAGNKRLGEGFLNHLKPFIWRKYLDFAAIEDIRSIKNQIDQHRKGAKICFENHNIKLGHGGIREIEFYTQTLQLIWGGKIAQLRLNDTIGALNILREVGKITKNTMRDFIDSYIFLRNLEHRLQMREDQQTQTMPNDLETLAKIAILMGFADIVSFKAEYERILNLVGDYFDQQFRETDQEHNQESISIGALPEFLTNLGFQNISMLMAQIENWLNGHYRATKSLRSQSLINKNLVFLLKALASGIDPDQAFIDFDRFLEKLPSGIQLFSLFDSNKELMQAIANIMGNAPKLANQLSYRPNLVESFLAPEENLKALDFNRLNLFYTQQLTQSIHQDYEQKLITLRELTQEQTFQKGIDFLSLQMDITKFFQGLSAVAEAVIAQIIPLVLTEFAQSHGKIENDFAILALGKLGASELLPASDLDLIFIYDDSLNAPSNGHKPLYPQVYFQRLSQRIISAFSLEMKGGTLYEIDMRFRPNGEGALATQFSTLHDYYQMESGIPISHKAWSFEYMAMTKARLVYFNQEAFALKIQDWHIKTLSLKRDRSFLLKAIEEMRERLDIDRGNMNLLNVKYHRGGLVDCEFLLQYLSLMNGNAHPDIFKSKHSLKRLDLMIEKEIINTDDGKTLKQCFLTCWKLQAILRLTLIDQTQAFAELPKGLQQKLYGLFKVKDRQKLEDMLQQSYKNGFALYEKIIK